MDYKFLDKVVDQIVRETRIDYDEEMLYTPSPYPPPLYSLPHSLLSFFPSLPLFSKHCREIYGLNKREIEYVWKEYKQIIKDKINNG